MNLSHFRSFLIIAEKKSITAAARELYISTTSLVQQLNLFESTLGFKVFDRSRKGVSLTPAGKRLYEEGRHLLAQADELLDSCKNLASQEEKRLRISLCKPYFLLQVCDMFSHEHPEVKLEIDRIEHLNDDDIESHFTQDHFDIIQLCLISDNNISPSYEVIPYPSDCLCCICSREHPLSKKSSATLNDLRNQMLETFDDSPYIYDLLKNKLDHAQIPYTLRRTLYTERSILKCCANGGIYIMNEQVARTVTKLPIIPFDPALSCSTGIAYMKNAKPAVQKFAQYVREHMEVIAAQYE